VHTRLSKPVLLRFLCLLSDGSGAIRVSPVSPEHVFPPRHCWGAYRPPSCRACPAPAAAAPPRVAARHGCLRFGYDCCRRPDYAFYL
jgi:hypothetical protein